MEITWYGHSCFRLAERGMATVITDPFDAREVGYEPLKLKADIVTVSHNAPGHNYVSAVKGNPYIITGPGEFEIGGVFITAIHTNGHLNHQTDEINNILCLYDFNGINVVHLGAINRVPTQTEVESLGPGHIALVSVGGGSGLNSAKASEVISLLEPNIVIPMHFATPDSLIKLDPLSKFLKEMGLEEKITRESTLKVTGVSSLSEETHVVVLDYFRG